MTEPITIATIGFTQKNAREFFTSLKEAGVKRVVDVRLNNVSQLAGFAKKGNIEYFLKEIADIEYLHMPELAPTKDILDGYKKKQIEWGVYETEFIKLLDARQAADSVTRELMDGACLLCSENGPEHCHRRLVAEYLQRKWDDVRIKHI